MGRGGAVRIGEERDRRGVGLRVEPPVHRPLVGEPSLLKLGAPLPRALFVLCWEHHPQHACQRRAEASQRLKRGQLMLCAAQLLIRVRPGRGAACALAGRRCSLWGRRKGVCGGGAFCRCEERLRCAPPPSTARPLGGLLGSANHVLWARVCRCGPTLSPWPACPACRGVGGGPSPGGVACPCFEGRLVSGAVPPPAAHPLGRAAGVLRPVCSRVRSVWASGPSTGPTACALAGRCCSLWGWQRGVPGGVPSTVVRGVWGQALPSPTCRPTGRPVAVRHPRAVGAGVWVWGPKTVRLACTPYGGCVPRGWLGAVPGGGGLPPL